MRQALPCKIERDVRLPNIVAIGAASVNKSSMKQARRVYRMALQQVAATRFVRIRE
jgi:hypothetical protein